jgi:hypothetical protein
MLGVLAIGLLARLALGGNAVSQRSQMSGPPMYTHRVSDGLINGDTDDSNHCRTATADV